MRPTIALLLALPGVALAEPSPCETFATKLSQCHAQTTGSDEAARAEDEALIQKVCSNFDEATVSAALQCLQSAQNDLDAAPCIQALPKAEEDQCRFFVEGQFKINLQNPEELGQLLQKEEIQPAINETIQLCTGHLDRLSAARAIFCSDRSLNQMDYNRCLYGATQQFASHEDCEKLAQTMFEQKLQAQSLSLSQYLESPAGRSAFDLFVHQCEGQLSKPAVERILREGLQSPIPLPASLNPEPKPETSDPTSAPKAAEPEKATAEPSPKP